MSTCICLTTCETLFTFMTSSWAFNISFSCLSHCITTSSPPTSKVPYVALMIISKHLKGFDKPTHFHPHKYTSISGLISGFRRYRYTKRFWRPNSIKKPEEKETWKLTAITNLVSHIVSGNQLISSRPAVCLSVCSAPRTLVKGGLQSNKNIPERFCKTGRPPFL